MQIATGNLWRNYFWWLACGVLCAGCGRSGPEVAPVSGRITLDGRPLENADIVFQPEDSKSPSYGRTGKDGHYALGYKRGVEGARVGWHNVAISVSKELVRNPPSFAHTELRREVEAGKNNVFDFELTSDGK
jgi:hypothetical protein